jgi:hypothetical protein
MRLEMNWYCEASEWLALTTKGSPMSSSRSATCAPPAASVRGYE